jgi:hypothetical protein
MKRIVLALAVAAASMGLASCAAIGGAAGGLAERAQAPAIAAIEASAAGGFERAIAAVEAAPEAVSRDEAAEIAGKAVQTMNVLVVARIAYDATIGASASIETQRQVADARANTDAALERLLRLLAPMLSGVSFTPT